MVRTQATLVRTKAGRLRDKEEGKCRELFQKSGQCLRFVNDGDEERNKVTCMSGRIGAGRC